MEVAGLDRAHLLGRPVQLVFAGKATCRDKGGKELIQRGVGAARRLAPRIRVVYLENYDLDLASLLVSGVDLWLNTPRRGSPTRAKSTGGMPTIRTMTAGRATHGNHRQIRYLQEAPASVRRSFAHEGASARRREPDDGGERAAAAPGGTGASRPINDFKQRATRTLIRGQAAASGGRWRNEPHGRPGPDDRTQDRNIFRECQPIFDSLVWIVSICQWVRRRAPRLSTTGVRGAGRGRVARVAGYWAARRCREPGIACRRCRWSGSGG